MFCLAASGHIREVMRELRRMDVAGEARDDRGGGNIGLRLAFALQEDYSVRVIEHNKRRCELLGARLGKALVLNGDATDEALLEDESIADMDLFVAVTNDDENNIMGSLLAKRMGARRVVALINRRSYVDLPQAGRSTSRSRRRRRPSERSSPTCAAATWWRCTACAAARPRRSRPWCTAAWSPRASPAGASKTSSCRPAPPWARGARRPGHHVPSRHADRAGDHVIVFVTSKRLVPLVEKLFQVSASFL